MSKEVKGQYNKVMSYENNIGRLSLHKDFVVDEKFSAIMAKAKMIPVRMEFIFATDKFEMMALSPLFDKIDINAEVPHYLLSVEYNKTNGRLKEVKAVQGV